LNYYEHHLADYTQATAHLSMLEDAAYSRMLRWYYANEKPLPPDIRQVERLVRAQSKQEREAIKNVLCEFFVLREDGWHQDRADREIARYQDKQAKAKRSANARWGNAVTHSEGNANASAKAMRTHSEGNAHHTPDTSHQTPDLNQVETHTQDQPPAGVCVSPVADCCKALVDAGIPATTINQSHPKLLRLIDAGATAIEFSETARECVDRGNPKFAYVLGTMIGRREQAASARLHTGAMTTRKPTPGQRTADAAQRWLESQPQEAIEHDAKG
jgi:uncharacterized protein YdaU (DUF1376 family)